MKLKKIAIPIVKIIKVCAFSKKIIKNFLFSVSNKGVKIFSKEYCTDGLVYALKQHV